MQLNIDELLAKVKDGSITRQEKQALDAALNEATRINRHAKQKAAQPALPIAADQHAELVRILVGELKKPLEDHELDHQFDPLIQNLKEGLNADVPNAEDVIHLLLRLGRKLIACQAQHRLEWWPPEDKNARAIQFQPRQLPKQFEEMLAEAAQQRVAEQEAHG